MNKTLDTLVSDIYSLAGDGEKPNWDNLSLYTKNCRGSFYRFREERDDSYEPRLRMSNIGKPARQVWYDIKKAPKEGLSGQMRLKFLQGDFLEEQALLLAREAGHFVQDTQKEVEIDGVKGRMDCKIDGLLLMLSLQVPMLSRSSRAVRLKTMIPLVTLIRSVDMHRQKERMKQLFLL